MTEQEKQSYIAKQTPLLKDKHLIGVYESNAIEKGKKILRKLRKKWNNIKFLCPELNNRRVIINNDSINHLDHTGDGDRDITEIVKRVELFPYIEDIIKGGKYYNKKQGYSLIGRAMINNKETGLRVILVEKGENLLYISIFCFDIV